MLFLRLGTWFFFVATISTGFSSLRWANRSEWIYQQELGYFAFFLVVWLTFLGFLLFAKVFKKRKWIEEQKKAGMEPEDGDWNQAYITKRFEDLAEEMSTPPETEAQRRMRLAENKKYWREN